MSHEVFMRELADLRRTEDEKLPVRNCPDWFPETPPLVEGAPHHWYTLNQLHLFGLACAEAYQPKQIVVAWRWRFLSGTDRTWRHCEVMPGFDPCLVEAQPLTRAD